MPALNAAPVDRLQRCIAPWLAQDYAEVPLQRGHGRLKYVAIAKTISFGGHCSWAPLTVKIQIWVEPSRM